MASFRIPTLAEIINGANEAIIGLIPDAGLTEGEDYANEAAIQGGMVWQLFAPIAYVEDQIFPDTAALVNLERHGRLHGVTRKDPSKSKGFLLITGTAGGTQIGGTPATSASGVEILTDVAAAVALPAWANKTVIAYDPARPNTVVLSNVTGMAIADPFELGGYTYVIKNLPGGGAVVIYGRFKVDPVLTDVVKPKAGRRVPITASAAGAAGNLPYDTAMTLASPGVNVDGTAYILEQSGGDDLEDPARWALRIQEVEVERNGGGNRSQYLTWALEILGVDRGFVYDVFRGLGTGDIVIQGVKGARHLSGTKIAEGQEYIRPFTPTDANPGKATMGGHDILVTDFTDRLVSLDLILSGGPGYGPDWQGFLTTAAGSSTLRVLTSTNPLGILVAGDRIVVPVGLKLLEVVRVQSVDAAGLNLEQPLTAAPAGGLRIYPGSSLHEPVRDALLAMFDELGPGDTIPPTRYPAPTTLAPAQLSLNLIHATVRAVPGLLNCEISQPSSDITPPPKAQCTPISIVLRFA